MDSGGLRHVVVSQASGRKIVPRAGFVKEVDLQTLCKDSPELLGPLGDDLTFVPIGWEVPLGVGRLDLLFLDSTGTLTLIETKLRANDESRREVIGQVLEYAVSASELTVDNLREFASVFYTSPQAPTDLVGMSLEQAIAVRLGWLAADEDERTANLNSVLEATARKLAAGQLRIVCGVDEHIESLERLVAYLSSHSDLEVVLLQVNRFPVSDDLLVLIPTLHGDTGGSMSRSPRTSAKPLTLSEILDSFAEASERETVASLLEGARRQNAVFAFGPSGLSIRARCPRRAEPVTVAWVYAPGKTPWMKTRDLSFGHGVDYAGIDPDILAVVDAYYARLVAAGVGADASSKGVRARWISPAGANQHMEFLLNEMGRVVADLGAIPPAPARESPV